MIKFGTSGWRAVMGGEFTFQNVRIVIQAIANYLHKKFAQEKITVIVNYDTRFLSERFALEAAKIFSHNKIHVFLADRDAPSQAQAFQIICRKAHAGVNFTASFNSPEYNGLKLNLETGAPALPQETEIIEKEAKRLMKEYEYCCHYPKKEFIKRINLQQQYLEYIQDKIDFGVIRKSKIKIAVDLLYGTSREYLDEILEENRIPIEEIHGYIDPYFGGINPSCAKENLCELSDLIREHKCIVGIATDADGGRFGIMDEKGNLVEQNIIVPLLLDYLLSHKGWRGGVARSISTTHLIDCIARKYDLPLYKTPVGFKFLADLYLKDKIIFGGEESSCLVIKDHIPEKDGIVAGLLVAEMIAAKGKNLSVLKEELFKEYGIRRGRNKDIPLNLEMKKKLNKLRKNPPQKLADRKVVEVEKIDGIKLIFSHDDWILLRLSGTIPVIRCYAEAGTKKELDNIITAGMKLLHK